MSAASLTGPVTRRSNKRPKERQSPQEKTARTPSASSGAAAFNRFMSLL